MRNQKAWTKDEEETLLRMRAENEKISYIAFKLKRSFSSVACKLSEIEATRGYKSWTEDEFNKAKRLREKGYSFKQVAMELNREHCEVKGKFQYMKRKQIECK